MENCATLLEGNLIFPCNRLVKAVPAGRIEISLMQNWTMKSPPLAG